MPDSVDNKSFCFIIMPQENLETEFLWDEVYEPITSQAGLLPVRIDKKRNGKQLSDQIVSWIQTAPILIGDLTLSRPNCYFEVGYTMGLNKHNNIILCCRSDHNMHHPEYVAKNGHKVHFDIQSYPVIWWDKNNIGKFKKELLKEIKQRMDEIKEIQVPVESILLQKTNVVYSSSANPQIGLKKALEELKQWKKKT